MSDQDNGAVREQVRSRYAQAARAVLEPGTGQAGCCEPSAGSCCGPSPAALAVGEFSQGLYRDGETDGLPADAVLASLGCGNPLAVAELREGERVLDLGSGGGIDVLLSARRVFVCTHNAGRSQMAAALLNQQAAGRVRVTSAGSQPASELNPAVVAAMAEIGLDISAEFPKPLDTGTVQAADVVITMGCGGACPVYPGKRYLDWDLPDPAGLTIEQIRPIRDEIGTRVRALVSDLGA